MFDVAIIGLGYVGLPFLKRCLEKDFSCLGIDIDKGKIEGLKQGKSFIKNIDVKNFVEEIDNKNLQFDSGFENISKVKTVIICLPTPITKNHTPDLSYIDASLKEIAKFAQKGTLIILESTTYPRTTEEVLKPVLEKTLGEVGKDFYLGYSPEREDPGNPLSNFDNVPKIVSGYTKACGQMVVNFYSKVCKNVVPVSSCSVAEMTKIWENTFRAINISAVNELKMICDRMGIDVWEVIEAAKTKPYGFTPFYPGPGMGGHCIPVDPFYLTWKAKEFGLHTRFIELAGEINFRMHKYVTDKVISALNNEAKAVKNSKVLVIGLSYKANIEDLRESPSLNIISRLQENGALVDYYDPHISQLPPSRKFKELEGKKSISITEESLKSYDACLILTAHRDVPYELLAEEAQVIVDSRNAMKDFVVKGKLYKA